LPLIGILAIKPVTPQPPSSAALWDSSVAPGSFALEATISDNISFTLRIALYLEIHLQIKD
jgi:hypothetical protein